MDINPETTTKSNKPRKGAANITRARRELRRNIWEPVKRALQCHLILSPKGEAKRIARSIGIAPSQIHRFTCPKCEHDQEPCFTIGFALLMYLSFSKLHPVFDITPKPKQNEKSNRIQKRSKTSNSR